MLIMMAARRDVLFLEYSTASVMARVSVHSDGCKVQNGARAAGYVHD